MDVRERAFFGRFISVCFHVWGHITMRKDVKKMSWFLDGCFDIIIFLKRRN